MLIWPRTHCLRTLVVDPKQPAFLCVTTETYQHLIGRAAGWVVGLSVCEDSQFSGRLLRTIPKAGGRSKFKGDKGDDVSRQPGAVCEQPQLEYAAFN